MDSGFVEHNGGFQLPNKTPPNRGVFCPSKLAIKYLTVAKPILALLRHEVYKPNVGNKEKKR